MAGDPRILKITLDERSVIRHSPQVDHERKVAIFDLLEENHFQPIGLEDAGPFIVHISIEENRLIFDLRDESETALERFGLAASTFRRIVKDYFMVCDSYYQAIKTAAPSKIEAIDMGRRGLHNEGAEILRERLKEKVLVDLPTARRLFTLVCVLHIKG